MLFRALHLLSVIDSTDFRRYTLADRYPAFARIPTDIDQLYCVDYAAFVWNGENAMQVGDWLRRSADGWKQTDGAISLMLARLEPNSFHGNRGDR
ncbi:MAG: hypothetical protein ABIW82_06680 [Dokdonella sp.]